MSKLAKSLCMGCKSTGCSCPGKGRLGSGIMTGETAQVMGHGFAGISSNVVAAKGQFARNATVVPPAPQSGGTGRPSALDTYGIDVVKGAGVIGTPLKEHVGVPFKLVGRGSITAGDVKGRSPHFSSSAVTLKGGRGKKGYSHPKKGQKSRTKKGRKDFTTKKGNKYFNRRGHRERHAQGSRRMRNPYNKSGGVGKKGYSHPKKGQKSRTKKGRKDFTTKKGHKYFNRRGHRQKRAQGSRKIRLPFQMGGTAPFPSNDNNILSAGQPNLNTKAQPGFNTNKGYTINPDSGVGGMFANPIPINSYKTCSTAPKF